MSSSSKNDIRVGKDKGAVATDVASYISQLAAEAIKARGHFHVAFSGGSLPGIVAGGLLSSKADTDFSKWKIYFSDERCVPLDHDDSNYLAVKSMFMDKVEGIDSKNVVTIKQSLVREPKKAAEAYEAELRTHTATAEGIPKLDLILLGMGPDGHTCSLFPGHDLLKESKRLIAPITDSPKPPSERITFTLPLVRAARARAFVAAGGEKAEILTKVISQPELQLPSSLVGPSVWFIDSAAASKLSSSTSAGKM